MIAYVKSYDGQTKWMYFLIEQDNFLTKYNAIWDKVSTNMKQECNSDPVYNKTFVKTKTKSMGAAATAFHDKKIPKMDSNCTYVAVISLKQMHCKTKRNVKHITEDIKSFSSDSYEEQIETKYHNVLW